RGYRVELGEIDAVLAQHGAVRECVTLAREDTSGEKRLAAYVVADPDTAGGATREVRSFLQTKLPDYMGPSAFAALDALPLTPNGKVNRRALPAPDQERSGPEESFVAPTTPTEEVLARIWCELLGLKRAGIHDNFFELGGHSLLMTQVISRV